MSVTQNTQPHCVNGRSSKPAGQKSLWFRENDVNQCKKPFWHLVPNCVSKKLLGGNLFWRFLTLAQYIWQSVRSGCLNPLFQILLHIFDHKSVVLSNVSGSRCKVAALESNWWHQSCPWLTVDIITPLISIVTLCLQVWLWESWHWTPYRLICGQYDIKLWMLDISGAPHVGEQTNMASSSKSFRSFVIEPRARCLSETSPSWTT